MLVNGAQTQSIWYDTQADCVKIIDQTRLPHCYEIESLNTLAEAVHAIRSMQVRGAPLIGITAAYGVYLALREGIALSAAYKELLATRPTAINLKWALDRQVDALRENETPQVALTLAQAIEKEDSAICAALGEHGADRLQQIWQQKKLSAGTPDQTPVLNILTHCNAGALATVDWGTALAVVYKSVERGLPVHVWVDETRPRNQGASLTCWELKQHNIDHTLIVDNTGGHLMQQGMVDVVVVGSDRTTANGDVCNKIGTYLKALAAFDNKVPFYAVVPLSTIDFSLASGAEIPIELRGEEEVTCIQGLDASGAVVEVRLAQQGTSAANYGFDVTPGRLVSGIVTEHGVFEANVEALSNLKRS